MEQIKSRILIQYDQSAVIAYLYNRESFELLNINKDEYDESQIISIGQIIEYDGTKYIVKNINFKMEKETIDMGHGYGISSYSPTAHSDYNSQIGIFVDNV